MDFWNSTVLGNPVSAYATFLGIVVGSMIFAAVARKVVLHYMEAWAAKTESKWDDILVRNVMAPGVWLFLIAGVRIGLESILLTEDAEVWANRIIKVWAVLILFFAFFRLVRSGVEIAGENYLDRAAKEKPADEMEIERRTVTRITRQVNEVAGMVIILMAVLTVLSNLGVNLQAIWASLGIGGIALALAVKDPLANLVGRVYIFSTGIFDVGHSIQINEWFGTVTRIGVFRTSLEVASDLSTVTIPNAEFISKAVKNNFGRKKFAFKWDLDVPYDVDADRLETLVDRLKALIAAKPEVVEDFRFVYVDRLDKYSKVVRVWFHARLPDWPASTQYGSAVLGEIQRLFAELGLDFAFPTYTVNVAGTASAPPVPPER